MPISTHILRGGAFGLAALCWIPVVPARPALEVVIVVDQFRGDYLDRFGPEFTGGLARFAQQGVVFLDARQDHAVTETAPGHSTTLSGRSPASTGIVINRIGVTDTSVQLLDAKGPGASPRRFQGTALYDWLRARDPSARALSVSRKDRGAILPIGRAKADVYWYSAGRFTTSTWYRSALPDWLIAWNGRRGAARLAGRTWTLLRPASSYPEPDSMPFENGGGDIAFPHRLPDDTTAAQRAVASTPWVDSLTIDVALEGVRALRLGRREGTDLLVLSLSATDEIGHDFGPDSREVHDQLLRLDRWLGAFFDSLAVLVPAERTVAVLTADHGVQPYPERTRTGGRTSIARLVRNLSSAVQARTGERFDVLETSGLVIADTVGLAARGVRVDSLAAALAGEVGRLPGVGAVFTPATLATAAPDDEEARLWRKTIPAAQPWLVAASLTPGWVWSEGSGSADHGTTNPDDTNVPIAFLVPRVPAARVARRVTTEDIGPTLGAIAGVSPGERVTGKVLVEVVPSRSSSR